MSRRFKSAVILYMLLGLMLGITGVLISWLSNTGILFSDNNIFRLVSLFLGFFLLVLGSHLVIASISSLKSK